MLRHLPAFLSQSCKTPCKKRNGTFVLDTVTSDAVFTRGVSLSYFCVWNFSVCLRAARLKADCRRLHNEELNDLYSLPNIIRMI